MKLRVVNKTRGTMVAEAADIADASESRREGLLKRTGLDPGEGLWIVPCEAVHCFFMKFTIDVLFLGKLKREAEDGDIWTSKVKKIRPSLKPWRIAGCLTAHSVLELPEGTIDASSTSEGDVLELVRVP